MLSALDNTPDTEIYIISSCETIGEGVDTKKANMCVFADPKSSVTKITKPDMRYTFSCLVIRLQ